MAGLFGNRVINFFGAFAFFFAACLLLVSAIWVVEYELNQPATPKPAAPAPGASRGPSQTESASRGAGRAANDASKKDGGAKPGTSAAQKPAAAPDQGLFQTAGTWINHNLGFHQISIEAKRSLSVLFSVIGTFFTIRTYLLNRRRLHLLEQSHKNGRPT